MMRIQNILEATKQWSMSITFNKVLISKIQYVGATHGEPV
uniref:Uncharacterized protein n=1 Tax=Arundo donax TaxID=35708 RepID=A0A0A8Y412_ARUDO